MQLTKKVHKLISKKLPYITYGIDATCGNGFDTLFLAKHCNSKVFSFDIQKKALDITRKKLNECNLLDRVELIHSGHEKILEYIKVEVDVIIFNLGYLPNSNKDIITKAKTTLTALKSSLKILKCKGLITVICYPGHLEGDQETEEVNILLKNLNKEKYLVNEYLSENPNKKTPKLYIIEKLT